MKDIYIRKSRILNSFSDTEDLEKAKRRKYSVGEISPNTGLQKQPDGSWAPPKKGAPSHISDPDKDKKEAKRETPAKRDMNSAIEIKGDLESSFVHVRRAFDKISDRLTDFNSPGLQSQMKEAIKAGLSGKGGFDVEAAEKKLQDYYARFSENIEADVKAGGMTSTAAVAKLSQIGWDRDKATRAVNSWKEASEQ